MTVDDGVLTLLRAGFANVWDGNVDADEKKKVIDVPMPFVLYYGKRTTPTNVRAGGRGERGNFVAMTCVAEDRDGADALANLVESLLDGQALGNRTVAFFERGEPARELRYTRPGGDPLFNVGLRFTV